MKRAFARLLRTAGVLLMCVSIATSNIVATRADDAPEPSGGGKYGDLQHLQYTASGRLPVSFIFPSDGYASAGVAARITAKTVNGAGVELRVNGDVIPARNLGRMAVSKDGSTQYDYFGVLLHAGPNRVTVTAIGANGIRGDSKTETIFGPGPAVAVRLSLMGHLVADAKTQAYLLIDAVDQWNHPAMSGSDVHVTLLAGAATIGTAIGALPNASPTPNALPSALAGISASSQPQTHYELAEGGRIQIPIAASLEPGTLQVQVAVGRATDTQAFVVAPYLRAPFVNGVISAGAGSVPAAVDGDGRYDAGDARKGRIGIFGSGKVGRASSLTFSYESQNRLLQSSSLGPYVADPNERPYLTYGDSSAVSSNFHSNDRLYARLDNGRNDIMWGQYDANVGDPEGIAHYHQQLSGVRAELGVGAPGRGGVVAFSARNTVAFVSFTSPVTGLGSLMQPLHPNIVIGSDLLTLVALDRRTGAVFSQTPLVRNLDYTIDYSTGTVRFLNTPLPFDEHFNPQVLYVQYQYAGAGVRSVTSGADFSYAFGGATRAKFDIGYMNDATGMSNYSLLTQTLSGALPSGEWRLSHANSAGAVPNASAFGTQPRTRGGATAFSFADRVAGNQVSIDYQNTGPGFANPFGGFTVSGLESVNASLAHQARGNHSTLTLTLNEQRNTGSAASSLQQSMTASWRALVSNALALTLGLQAQRETNGPGVIAAGQEPVQPITGSAAQVQFGARWRPAARWNLDVQHQAALGGSSAVLPSQTSVEVDYDLPKQGKLYLRELLGGAISSFAQSTAGLTSPSVGSRSTQFGIARTIGANTAVDSSYLIADTGNATNVYTTLGVQETFKFGKRLGGNATMQSARATGKSAEGFTVFGGSLSYTDLKDFRASLAVQTRGGFGGGTTLNGGATGHVGPNIAVIGAFDQTFGSGIFSVNDRLSVAYRPQEDDRFISLVSLDRQSGGYSANEGTADVLSFEEIYRPFARTEVVGRFGYKLNGDGFYVAHSSVAGLRLAQQLAARFDIGAEVREMGAGNITGAKATDLASELGYRIGSGTRIAAGYNFSGSVDPTLTGHPQRRGFYLTVTTLVDRVFGWGKQ